MSCFGLAAETTPHEFCHMVDYAALPFSIRHAVRQRNQTWISGDGLLYYANLFTNTLIFNYDVFISNMRADLFTMS